VRVSDLDDVALYASGQMRRRPPQLLFRLYRVLPRRLRRWLVHRVAPSFTVGAICVVDRGDGAILLIRHSYRRRWGLPGGLLARGEAPEDAARRECVEEVGLEVEIITPPSVVVDAGQRRVDVVFAARPASRADISSLRSRSPEVEEVRWFQRSALPELQNETSSALAALEDADTRTRGRRSDTAPTARHAKGPRE
jgi:ADP-ribose pyrophosphatase YjhB (NUDIX family)